MSAYLWWKIILSGPIFPVSIAAITVRFVRQQKKRREKRKINVQSHHFRMITHKSVTFLCGNQLPVSDKFSSLSSQNITSFDVSAPKTNRYSHKIQPIKLSTNTRERQRNTPFSVQQFIRNAIDREPPLGEEHIDTLPFQKSVAAIIV